MITIQNLTHIYPGTRKRPARKALSNIQLTIADGEFFVLTGPNGGGKSTLFRLLSGLMLPSQGSITLDGVDLFNHPQAARSKMGVVFQKPALDKYLTVLENLRIHADLYNIPPPVFARRLAHLLTWTDLQDRLNDNVEHLSGGLARQVELAKALLHEPTILLMDEPTTGLDPNLRHAFMQTLQKIRAERPITIIMTSHLFSEAQHADTVAILTQGRLIARDRPAQLKALLGREMLIIQTMDPDRLIDLLGQDASLVIKRHQHEIRVEGGDSLALMATLLGHHRAIIQSLSIKQPELEDVYIHLTGRPISDDEESA